MTPEVQSEIQILLDGQPIASLPMELKDLALSIENSKYILDLEENFDGEQSTRYSKDVW